MLAAFWSFMKTAREKAAYSVSHGSIADGATSSAAIAPGQEPEALAAMSIPVGALEQIVNAALPRR